MKRPSWKAATIVLPKEKVSGSTCVACWLVEFVYGSELILVSGTFADAPIVERSVSADAAPTANHR